MAVAHKKIIVTGGAGFIGSHLAKYLFDHGQNLVLIDDLSTGCRDNIDPLLLADPSRCCFIHGCAGNVLAQQPEVLHGADQLYHLAASVGVMHVIGNPITMIRNNVEQTDAVLTAAASHGLTVLISSSSEVYGRHANPPFREDQALTYGPTTESRWAYGMTKALDEHLALAHHQSSRLGVVVVRLFNTIGPRQIGRYGMVAPRFIDQAVAGQPLEVFGDGRQTRCFCDVRDVVSTMAALIDQPQHHGQIFNLGSDDEISINELADRVITLTGHQAGKRYVPYEQAYGQQMVDLQRRVPDLAKIKNAIGFKPVYSLDQTLHDMITLANTGEDSHCNTMTRPLSNPICSGESEIQISNSECPQ